MTSRSQQGTEANNNPLSDIRCRLKNVKIDKINRPRLVDLINQLIEMSASGPRIQTGLPGHQASTYSSPIADIVVTGPGS